MKLGSKLLLQTVLPAIAAVSLLLAIVTLVARNALQDAAERALAAVAEARREDIHNHFERMRNDIVSMGNAPAVIAAMQQFATAFAACGANADSQLQQLYDSDAEHAASLANNPCRRGYQQAHREHDVFFRRRHAVYGWKDILLVDRQGHVVYSLLKDHDFATNLFTGPWKDSSLARVAVIALRQAVSGVPSFADAEHYAAAGNRPAMFLAIPVIEPETGQPLGALVAQIAFEPLDRHMHFKAGLGQSGEAFVVGSGGWMLTNTFFDQESSVLKRQLQTEAVNRVLAGNDGSDQLIDYRGQPSFIAYRQLQPFAGALGDQPRWGVIAKISRDEALSSLYSLQWLMLGSGLLIAGAATAIAVVGGRRLLQPVLAMQTALGRLASGEKTAIPGLDRQDEIGDMAKAAESFRKMSEAVARDRWIHENVATLTTAVSQEETLADVADTLLGHLRRQLDVPVATLFLRDADGHYRRAGAQGLARRSQSQDRFAPGESLVGQCARDGQAVILAPVGGGLMMIATGLAEFPPDELVLYPITHQNQTLAVVELAATRRLSPDEHAFLAALVGPLGLHLANIEAAERNLALLDESRQQAKLLGQQKAELADRNSEMLALSDEMRAQSDELKAQNATLRGTQEELRVRQEELAEKNRRLEAQGRQLELGRSEAETRARELAQANRYKSQFLANMSHELRTPLNSILILAKHLAENATGHLDDDEVESASVIHESGSQLLSLINDILDLSRIEAGKVEMLIRDFPVSEILLYLRRLFEPLAAKKSIAFSIEVEATAVPMIHSDRRLLTQILTNLLSNAIKFTDRGSVRLVLCAEDRGLRFDIIDSGIGIAADQIERIFNAFQQVDGSSARKYGGSGLGLAISRQLVALLGGRIDIESTPGSGSRFSVHLPDIVSCGSSPPVPAAPAAPAAPAVAARPATADRHTLILVVEDDGHLVMLVTRLIETLGYAVLAVNSGEKALELIAAERPAGVLLDLGLPGIPGLEVLRRMKSNPDSADIPVYIISGAADTGEAAALGAAGYIRKPITRDAVLAALRDMLDRSPVPAAQSARQRQVLLIEDDQASSQAVRVLFKETNIELSQVHNGSDGLAAIAATRYDAVILDLMLPDMSGFEWLEQAAATPQPPPVVVYSARDLDDAELLRLHAHADAVISKGRLNGQASSRLREEVLLAVARQTMESDAAPAAARARHEALLIVDDDVRNQSALSKALRARGFAVSVAGSGAQAMEMMATGQFAAVLTDIMMPGMDGYELIRRMRGGSSGQIPIIAVTAKAMPGDVELCLAAGASDYLAKPVDIDRLLQLLEKWL
ncbi:MAG: response regulator [Candidatus Accumulibacter phosphatis]|nr:response regulator [Candidatus Accumulibacter phosphatis]